MRNLVLGLAVFMIPVCAQAQSVFYLEGNIGAAFVNEVDTEDYTFSDGVDTYDGRFTLDYGTALVVGLEAGVGGYADGSVRFGVSWDYTNLEVDDLTLSGTVNGVPDSITIPDSVLNGAGIDLDEPVHIVLANAYYNLPLLAGRIRPYIGVGAGAALFEHADTEMALSAAAGIRVALDDTLYVGGKYRFTHISGPTDELGIEYDPVNFSTLMFVIGLYAN